MPPAGLLCRIACVRNGIVLCLMGFGFANAKSWVLGEFGVSFSGTTAALSLSWAITFALAPIVFRLVEARECPACLCVALDIICEGHRALLRFRIRIGKCV